jgi:hypothetical protein
MPTTSPEGGLQGMLKAPLQGSEAPEGAGFDYHVLFERMWPRRIAPVGHTQPIGSTTAECAPGIAIGFVVRQCGFIFVRLLFGGPR